MAHALKRIRTKQDEQSSWPILVLLLVAVSVSGTCVLWFMVQAIALRVPTPQRIAMSVRRGWVSVLSGE